MGRGGQMPQRDEEVQRVRVICEHISNDNESPKFLQAIDETTRGLNCQTARNMNSFPRLSTTEVSVSKTLLSMICTHCTQ